MTGLGFPFPFQNIVKICRAKILANEADNWYPMMDYV